MKILIVGGGGREHALAWKMAQSVKVDTVYVAPGNAGTAREAGVQNVDIGAQDILALLEFAKHETVDLTIIGPEAPLVLGIVNVFQQAGLNCFGPTKGAAQLEGSKTFAKDFLARHNIPTAAYSTFTDSGEATNYIKNIGAPIVVKADGLAAGKGVILATSEQQAITAVNDMLAGNAFGDAGHQVVIEEFLAGEEVSFIVMVDSAGHILPLATSQDHKARDDGDTGPNTGGMGAYSPAPLVDAELHDQIIKEIIEPTVHGMAAEKLPYTGFLYAGLMVGNNGSVKVLEYNCRFGDPETQPILMRLNTDLVELVEAALSGKLDTDSATWDPRTAIGIVMAAGGYPENYQTGDIIEGIDLANGENTKVFHAGTATKNNMVITSGGRVLCVTALGESVSEAQKTAYAAVKTIHWPNAFYRNDIGYRAIAREQKTN